MNGKKETFVAYGLAAILLLVAVISYAAYPAKAPEEPIRLVLKNIGGNVLFDHKKHASDEGYGIGCKDCHHDMEDENSKVIACGECHTPSGEDALRRPDAMHKQCQGCHEDFGLGPVDCSGCHLTR
jgi:hypothetical protein